MDPHDAQSEAEGFFDIDAGDELLRGVTMADCGNVTVAPSDVVKNFEKLTTAVEKMSARGPLRLSTVIVPSSSSDSSLRSE